MYHLGYQFPAPARIDRIGTSWEHRTLPSLLLHMKCWSFSVEAAADAAAAVDAAVETAVRPSTSMYSLVWWHKHSLFSCVIACVWSGGCSLNLRGQASAYGSTVPLLPQLCQVICRSLRFAKKTEVESGVASVIPEFLPCPFRLDALEDWVMNIFRITRTISHYPWCSSRIAFKRIRSYSRVRPSRI